MEETTNTATRDKDVNLMDGIVEIEDKDDFALGNDDFVDREDNGLHTFVKGATTAQRSPSRAALQELIHNLSCFESAHTTEGFGVDDCRGNSLYLQPLEYLRQGGPGDG